MTSRRSGPPPILLLVLAVAGCGVSAYDADYKARVAEFVVDAEFAGLDPTPREFADGRVRVHLPVKFDPVQDDTSLPVSLSFLRTLEEATAFNLPLFTANNLERRPVVIVAAVPTSRRKPDDLKREISGWIELEGAFRGRSWETRTVVPAKGGPDAWSVLSLDGEQNFEATKQGVDGLVDLSLQGSGSLWLSAAPERDYCVIVAVRIPDEVADQFRNPADKLAELMARRVEIVPPPGAEDPVAAAR